MDFTNGKFDWGSWRDAFFIPRPCMLRSDGTVAYYLNENNYALKEDGSNLQYVVKNPSVKLTPEMIYTAVNNYPAAIFDVPAEMRDNAIKEFAFDRDPTLMKNFTNIRKEYINRKIKEDPSFIRFLNDPDEDLVCKAIENDPNYCVYVKKFTPRIKKLIETLYPDIIPLIPGFNERS